jgi:Ser/Thr protein kinase RdoA (MazF antagonist)
MTDVLNIAANFELSSAPSSYRECSEGHINGTYFIYCENGERYVLQRINTSVFKDPDGLMRNIIGVTEHISKKIEAAGGDVKRGTLHFIQTKGGQIYYRDENGGCWRAYEYVRNVVGYQSAESPKVFESVGRAFGKFQMQLADYDVEKLVETIPDFHNTPARYRAFEEALAANAAGRAESIPDEIAFVKEHRVICSYITDRMEAGVLPRRVTHNDTKLNNILLDKVTGKPVCVIDLDTVMPGSVLFDFGDAIRFGASSAAEDETDLSLVTLSVDRYRAYAATYLEAEGLTEKEKELLPEGALMMTVECGMRFLTDYLLGDTYFRIHRPQHNLDRARTQIRLAQHMEAAWDILKSMR